MNRPATKGDLVGKTIARVLQTEWEHSEEYSSCNYYLEFTDGTLVWLECDSFPWVCTGGRESLKDVETDTGYPACFSSDGSTGIGRTVDNVITTSYGNVYLVLSGQYYLTAELGEGHPSLYVNDRADFLQQARIWEFFDYWTKEPCIFDNMRAIDVVVESNARDLKLWQSRELFLTIGPVKAGQVSDRLALTNERIAGGWKARFVVPELGEYRIAVQRQRREFVADIQIDEAVISAGFVKIRVV